MVILITGASHTGKTVLAQKLLEKLHYPYLSVDHLKMGLIRSGQTDLTPEDDEKLTAYLWPIVREIVKTAIENRQSLIVEGCYVPFDWRKDFDAQYLDAIRFICLAMTAALPLLPGYHNHLHNVLGILAGVLTQVCVWFICPWCLMLWLLYVVLLLIHAFPDRSWAAKIADKTNGKGVFLLEAVSSVALYAAMTTANLSLQ